MVRRHLSLLFALLLSITLLCTSAQGAPAISLAFSQPAGYAADPFDLTITSNSSLATIYYTTDGSVPTINSTIYTGPIHITNNSDKPNNLSMIVNTSPSWKAPLGEVQKVTVVRAIAVDGAQASAVKTSTYLVDASFTLPVVSVSTNYDNLFDYNNGIYLKGAVWDEADANGWQGTPTFHPANYREDWERPVHLEFFEYNGTRVVDQDVGIQISGQGSRSRQQKSLRFYARKDYGPSSIPYPLFPTQSITSYKRATLRNPDDNSRTTFLRDVLAAKIVSNISLPYEDYRPVVVFLNGEYWGLYPLREKANQHYLASHYGVNSDDVVILEDNAILDEGVPGDEQPYLNLIDYVNTHDLQVPANYAYVQSQMDTENFARYYAVETYIGNTDWPSRNIVIWRTKTGNLSATKFGQDGRWRWTLHDADYAFGYVTTQGPDYDMFEHIEKTTWGGALWRSLARNEQFRNQFVTLSADQLRTNFASENIIPILDTLAAGIAPEVPQQIARWTALESIAQWNNNIEYLRSYIRARPAYHRAHIISHFGLGGLVNLTVTGDSDLGTVQVNTLNVSTPSTGTYFADIPITLIARPQPGKFFVGWTGAASGADSNISIVLAHDASVGALFADAPAAAPMGTAWVSRKYPATQVKVSELENVTLQIEVMNPSNDVLTNSWSIDGVPVSNSDTAMLFVATTAGNHTVQVTVSGSSTNIVQHWQVEVQKASGHFCYSQLGDLPANCEGGAITVDTTGGCRTLVCNSTSASMKVLACEKPTSTNPTWFEMYRQSTSGTGLKMCLANTCLSTNGFAQANFPVCVDTTLVRDISFASTYPSTNAVTLQLGENETFNYSVNNPASLPVGSRWYLNGELDPLAEDLSTYEFISLSNGTFTLLLNVSSNETSITRTWSITVLNTPVGNNTNTTACYSHLAEIPASCSGGTITQDDGVGCRTIICSATDASLKVLACEKPDGAVKQYFEMYKQSQTGHGVKICLGETCIQNEGYAKSPNFPICAGNVTIPPTNTTNTTNSTNATNSTNSTAVNNSVVLSIAPWFPQGRNYVFVCSANFAPTSYDFRFGDGEKQLNAQQNNVYYTYAAAGNYTVQCTARNASVTVVSELPVLVS